MLYKGFAAISDKSFFRTTMGDGNALLWLQTLKIPRFKYVR